MEWRFADGTDLKGNIVTPTGNSYNADTAQAPVSYDVYYIVTDKCTECVGFHEEPQCAAVCPVDCCVPDEDHVESESQLTAKKEFMHL
jgi:ferredoxin